MSSVIFEYTILKMDQFFQLVCCTGLFMVAGFLWHRFLTVSIWKDIIWKLLMDYAWYVIILQLGLSGLRLKLQRISTRCKDMCLLPISMSITLWMSCHDLTVELGLHLIAWKCSLPICFEHKLSVFGLSAFFDSFTSFGSWIKQTSYTIFTVCLNNQC